MARWGVTANKGSASVQSVMLLLAAAASPRRAKLYDWTLGCGASPADNVFTHIIQRCTTAGTGTTTTPNSLDPADTLASTIVTKDTVTADPTLTASAFLAQSTQHSSHLSVGCSAVRGDSRSRNGEQRAHARVERGERDHDGLRRLLRGVLIHV